MLYLTTFAGLVGLRFTNARSIYFPILIGLFIFSAFRFEVGCDWSGYLNQFYVYAPMSYPEVIAEREPLWVGLFAFQHWLGLPYPWINVFSSAIFFAGVHVLAKRQPDPLAFLILLFPILIINMPMSGIRQGAAIGVICIAFVAFTDGRLFRFLVLTTLAAGLHSSAIIFLLLAPLVGASDSKSRLAFCALLAVPGTLLLLSTQGAEIATSRYGAAGDQAAGAAFRVGLLSVTGLIFFVSLKQKWASTFKNDYEIITVGSLIMIALIGVVPLSTVIGDRLGYYLVPIQAVILARLPFLPLGAHRQLFIVAPYAALFMVFATWTMMSALFDQCYLPYQTWLFGFPEARYYF